LQKRKVLGVQRVLLLCAAEIGAIIGRKFWCHDYASRDLNKSALIGRVVVGEALNEDFSDFCIGEVLGTTSVSVVIRLVE